MIFGTTGHRFVQQKPGELSQFARRVVDTWQGLGVTSVITGMAIGWDLDVAEAALDAGLPYIAAIPFPQQADRWSTPERERYERLRSQAASEIVSGRLPLDRFHHERDRWIVDKCEQLWALNSGRRSGTDRTVNYAQAQHRHIINLWPGWLEYRSIAPAWRFRYAANRACGWLHHRFSTIRWPA